MVAHSETELSGIPRNVLKQGQAADAAAIKLAEGKPLNLKQVEDDKGDLSSQKIDNPESEKTTVDINKDPLKVVEGQSAEMEEAIKKQNENREKTLQGILDKYKTESEQKINNLMAKIDEANQTINNLNAIIAGKTSKQDNGDQVIEQVITDKKPDDQVTTFKKVNPEDFEGYGDEMTGLVNGFNALVDMNQKLIEQVRNIDSTVQVTEQKIVKDTIVDFEKEMDKAVPGWKIINHDPLFKKWLDLNPDFNTIVQNAGQTLNVASAAKMFKLFIRETNYVVDQSRADNTQYNIQDEILPDNSGSGDEGVTTGSFTIVTRKQFNEAARDRALGKIDEKTFENISVNFQKSIQAGKVT